MTWAPGGNLPPLLAAASLLAARGHDVKVLASAATGPAAERAGFEVLGYRRSSAPDTRVAFERQAEAMMAAASGREIACDVRDVLAAVRPELAIADCMLPAALAAGAATGTPTASLAHFLYGRARQVMLCHGGGWTTDLDALAATHRALGLPAPRDGVAAWEAAELVLITAPRWLDVEQEYPMHVVHAGPLGTRASSRRVDEQPPHVLLSFSTTVMGGQREAIQRVCDAIAATAVRATLTLGPAVDTATLRTPGNVDVVPWADHDRLLPRCAATITHGGLGTTLRALAHGVPLLLLPLGRDQAFNAAGVVAHGAGLQLPPTADPTAIAAALRRLLDEPGFRAAAIDAAARIAADAPDRRAADALERCVHSRQIRPGFQGM